MKEVIFINDKFSPTWETYFSRYNIKKPILNSLYTIRQIVNHTKGEKGLLLNELWNNETPKISPLSGEKGFGEQDWAVSRFSDLRGFPLNEEELRELQRELKHKEELVKIKTKEDGI